MKHKNLHLNMSLSLDMFRKKEHEHLSISESKILYSARSQTTNSRGPGRFFTKVLFVNWWLFGTKNVVSYPRLLYVALRF